jgi:ParB-like chromosome segregation protein Spo0J
MTATDLSLIPIGSVTPHPANPRRGNVDAIADSLRAHGQFRPIVVSTRTNHILAGNHTWQAAKRLRWRKIAAVFVDVDEAGERKIILADNRTADLAGYNDGALSELLHALPTLDDTGFVRGDLDEIDGIFHPAPSRSGGDGISRPPATPDVASDAEIAVSSIRLTVDRDAFEAWANPIEQMPRKPEATISDRLGFPEPSTKPSDPETTPVRLSTVNAMTVPVSSLRKFPNNARQGDVGAIAESLRVNGQFRPIVVNRPTMTVLVGNHTLQAAIMLGWEEIAVTFIDVDEDEAARIVIIDNRTSDLAGYDDESLTALLRSVGDPSGTGYDLDDLDDLLSGGSGKPSRPVGGPVRISVDRFRFTVRRDVFDEWARYVGDDPHETVATRLELPPGTWTHN